MRFFLLFLFFSFSSFSFSQIDGVDEVYLNGDFIDPVFEEGYIETFYNYVYDRFDTTKLSTEGQIIFTFDVNEEGKIKNIRILQDLGKESVVELIRVLKTAPNWTPAKRGGKAVSVNFKIPLTFKRS